EAEQRQLLEEYSDTPIACSPDITLPDLFSRQVSVMPDSTVVVYGDQRFSYGELDELSTRLACYLRQEYRIGRDDKVAIMLERSLLLILAISGLLKAGAAYVPLDADYPRARKSFILEDTGSPVLITQAGNLFDLEYFTGAVFAIDVQLETLDATTVAPTAAIQGADLAYVIYTSGSTGTPKGVMIQHQAIVNTIQSQQALFEAAPGDRHLQFAAASFDASVS